MNKTLLPPIFQKVLKNKGERCTIVTLAFVPVNTTCSFDKPSHPDGQPFHSEGTVYEDVTKSHKCARERTYKPDSVPPVVQLNVGGDHFSGIRVASNLKRPTRRPRPGQPFRVYDRKRSTRPSSYLALHQATLTVPVMSPPPRWALTPPFHPYLIRSD